MHGDLGLLVSLSLSLMLALAFGLITERLRLSPIVGYLLAGMVLAPATPGLTADAEVAQQFAEIGVVLLMFGVGLHFDLTDLLAVRKVAVPGAIGQIVVATVLGCAATMLMGGTIAAGLITGVSISVASTVVLARVLSDNRVLDTTHGHIAVGWLIVEDLFTVLMLVLLPAFAGITREAPPTAMDLLGGLAIAVVKLTGLGLVVIAGGRKVFPWLLAQVAKSRSRELFTLSIFALALAVATGSTVFFGVSMALGAFLAGMVVGQTEVSHQAASDALPMRDAFAVLFFVSVGMLFDPRLVAAQPGLLLMLLGIILIAKPLTALAIVWMLRYSLRSALTVAVGLAQIGEFSFLLANEAMRHRLLSAQQQSLLVTCALISITLNPLLFRVLGPLEAYIRGRTGLWKSLSGRAEIGGAELNRSMRRHVAEAHELAGGKRAVIVGFGPVGQTAARILREFQILPVIVDLNLETVRGLANAGQPAIYGDATRGDILEAAGIREANYLLITVPDVLLRTVIILTSKQLNPELRIFARARYIQERAWLEEIGATEICTEEAETALGLAVLLLREVGADEARIQSEAKRIEKELSLRQQ